VELKEKAGFDPGLLYANPSRAAAIGNCPKDSGRIGKKCFSELCWITHAAISLARSCSSSPL
jgi:hypothetical protein